MSCVFCAIWENVIKCPSHIWWLDLGHGKCPQDFGGHFWATEHFSGHRASLSTALHKQSKRPPMWGDGMAEHAAKALGTNCTCCTASSPRKLCKRQFAPLSAPKPKSQPAQHSQPAQPMASRLNPRRYAARLQKSRRLESPLTLTPDIKR